MNLLKKGINKIMIRGKTKYKKQKRNVRPREKHLNERETRAASMAEKT